MRLWGRRSRPSELTGKRHLCHFLKTSVHPFLGDWHTLWYGTRRIVPAPLIREHLTSFAFAVLFCDDGHIAKHGAFLYTMAFSTSEVRALAELLERRFALPASIVPSLSSLVTVCRAILRPGGGGGRGGSCIV